MVWRENENQPQKIITIIFQEWRNWSWIGKKGWIPIFQPGQAQFFLFSINQYSYNWFWFGN
jgi:hypothetical protein